MAKHEHFWFPGGVEGKSQILTKEHGLIPITDLQDSDLVWDGAEFVSHGGVVFLGCMENITYDGVRASPGAYVYTTRRPAPIVFAIAEKQKIQCVRDERTEGYRAPDVRSQTDVTGLYTIQNCGSRHRFACNGHLIHNLTV